VSRAVSAHKNTSLKFGNVTPTSSSGPTCNPSLDDSTAQKKQSLRRRCRAPRSHRIEKLLAQKKDAAQDLQARIEAEDKGHLWLAEVLG